MSLDAGMVGKTIKVGVAKILEDAGAGADLTATLTAEIPRRNGGLARRLTWADTGNQWHSSPTTKTVAAGEEVTFPNVPPTNSAGWRLDGVTPSLGATGHVFTYTLTMQATVAGQRLTLLSESFVLPEDAPDEIDADTLIEASASSGATINIVDQWSALVAAAQAAAEAAADSVGTVVDGVSTALDTLGLPIDGDSLAETIAAQVPVLSDLASVSADGALSIGKATRVDASGGARTMTLANGTTKGQVATVEKFDSGINPVTVTGKIRSTAAGSFTLSYQYETITFIWMGTYWEPVHGHRTKSSIDTQVAKGAGVAGFIQRMQAGENVKITCVGDSILEGLTTTTPATDAAMVKLGAALASRFGVTVTVSNHAESGFTAARAGLGGNFAAAIAEDPDLIIISAFDKNDLGADINGQYAPGYALSLSNAAIERLIRDVRTQRPKCAIALMTTNPYAAGNSANPYQVAKDKSVKRLAGALGVEVIDCYQAFIDYGDYSGLMFDDTHPNTAGHQLIADTLLDHFPNKTFPPAMRPAAITSLGYYHPENVDTSTGVSGYMGGTSPGTRFSGKHVWSISGSGWTLDGSSRDVSSTPGDYMEHTFYGTESLVQLDTTAALGLHLKITVDGVDTVTNQDMTLGKQGIYFITGASGLTAGTHTVRYTIVSGTFKISNVTALAAPTPAAAAVSTRQVIAPTTGTTTLTTSYASLGQTTVDLGTASVDLLISWRVQYRNSGAMTADRRIQVRPMFNLADISSTTLADVPIPTATATSTRAPVQGSALVKGVSGVKDFRLNAKVSDATDTIQAISWQMDVVIIPA